MYTIEVCVCNVKITNYKMYNKVYIKTINTVL